MRSQLAGMVDWQMTIERAAKRLLEFVAFDTARAHFWQAFITPRPGEPFDDRGDMSDYWSTHEAYRMWRIACASAPIPETVATELLSKGIAGRKAERARLCDQLGIAPAGRPMFEGVDGVPETPPVWEWLTLCIHRERLQHPPVAGRRLSEAGAK
jgi:hypothetical protein